MGIASGIALACSQNKEQRNIWTFISEGELYEGSIWESLIFIKHHKLTNIKIILDINNLIILGKTEKCLKLQPIEKKLNGFGFKTKSINGHNYKQIISGLNFLKNNSNENKILLANTVKGNSVSFMENKPEWHYWQNLDKTNKSKLLKELKL